MTDDSRKKNIERVKVFLRVRPLTDEDVKSSGKDTIIEQVDLTRNSISIQKDGDHKSFTFDSVFEHNSSQKAIYLKVGKPVVEGILDGFNGTIFAYGQTGTGKTHTMIGTSKKLKGLIPRCMKSIFYIARSSYTHNYTVKVGFIQLYMEVFQDLIKPNPNNPIIIREDSEEGVHLACVT